MKFNTLKSSIYILIVILVCISCGNDDDDEFVTVPERDRAEQQLADNDSIVKYLSTHYYNSGFFETGDNHTYTDIVITELQPDEDVPESHTLLLEAVETNMTEYLETDYEYYILRINQGGGDAPRFTDSVRVRYEGFSVDSGDIFDGVATPAEVPLQGNLINTSGAIKAWQLVMPEFNTSFDFTTDNGAVNFTNFGLGVMFIPSGLAYFSGNNTGSSYDNIIFKFELLQLTEIDHDNDGIPSYVEDVNGNLIAEDDDTDGNTLPDFIDVDDDGDDTLTRDEIILKIYTEDEEMTPFMSEMEAQEYFENNAASNEILISIDYNTIDFTYTLNTLVIPDSNSDGIPDYLDDTITINYNDD